MAQQDVLQNPRPESWPEEIILPVFGTDYQEDRGLLRLLLPKQAVNLLPEPSNPKDKNAVSVWVPPRGKPRDVPDTASQRIGYIPKNYAPIIARLLKENRILNCAISRIGTNDRGVWRTSIVIVYEAQQDEVQKIREVMEMMAVPDIKVAGAIANAADSDEEISMFIAQHEEGVFE